MRIGHYAPQIWAPGGIASYVQRVGNAQVEAGHQVYYLTRAPGANHALNRTVGVTDDHDLFRKADTLGLDILHLHKEVGILPQDRVPTLRTVHGNQASCPSGTRYLAARMAPCHRAYSVSGCLYGTFVERCGSRRPQKIGSHFRRIKKELNVLPHICTLTVSQFLKDQMERAGYEPAGIHVLHSPAPRTSAPVPIQDGDSIRFLFVGRIVPEKGLGWLLRAMRQVPDRVHLDVAGDGYELDAMIRLASQLAVAHRVTFHGWVQPSRVTELMRGARAVAFPSIWHEPAGLVTLEAASLGRPVIASRVGGIPEYAHRESSLLVDPNNVSQLASALEVLSSDRLMAQEMGRRGWERVQQKFSMDGFLQRLHAHYLNVLGE